MFNKKEYQKIYYKNWRKKHPYKIRKDGWLKIRKEILLRDNYICQNCGNKANEVHHRDGSASNKSRKIANNNLENLISVCHRCNILLDLKRFGGSFSGGNYKKNFVRDNKIKKLSKTLSQTDVSKKFNLTRQRIHQIVSY